MPSRFASTPVAVIVVRVLCDLIWRGGGSQCSREPPGEGPLWPWEAPRIAERHLIESGVAVSEHGDAATRSSVIEEARLDNDWTAGPQIQRSSILRSLDVLRSQLEVGGQGGDAFNVAGSPHGALSGDT